MDTGLDNFAFLLGDTARVLRGRFDQYARAHGMTRAQWLVLVTLMRNEGASQARVAALLEVEPITLSRMVDRLEAAGHVRRTLDPADRRIKRLHLTDSAREVLARLRRLGGQVMAEASDGVDAADVEMFIATLRRFRANLVNAGGRSPDDPAPTDDD